MKADITVDMNHISVTYDDNPSSASNALKQKIIRAFSYGLGHIHEEVPIVIEVLTGQLSSLHGQEGYARVLLEMYRKGSSIPTDDMNCRYFIERAIIAQQRRWRV